MNGFAAALLAATLTTSPAAEQAPSTARPEPVRRAVLIGINDYAAPGLVDLQGAVNDVATMQRILAGFGFTAASTKVLTDREATRAGILAALDELVRSAGEDDIVYIHFSGHGSQIDDANGDETDDGMDETILPWDARTEGVADITDDELGSVLGRLRSSRAVIVLDSCHSGTATRGGPVARWVPPDPRKALYRPRATSTRAVVALDRPERYVLMTGAASYQSALDLPLPGRHGGLFTYALAESLAVLGPEASPRDLHAEIAEQLLRLSESLGGLRFPEPQIESSPERLDRPLFPTAPGVASRSYAELRVRPSGRTVLADGVLLGATVGSTWEIHGPAELVFAPSDAVGEARVVALDGLDAVLEPGDAGLPRSGRAVLRAAAPEDRVTVRWADGERRGALESLVRQRLPQVVFADSGVSRFVVQAEGRRFEVLRGAGDGSVDAFVAAEDTEAAERLARTFRRSLNVATLLGLRPPASRIRIEARRVGNAGAPLTVRRAGEARGRDNSLQLEIQVNADSYLTVVDVDPQGELSLLFPTPRARPEFLPAGRVGGGTPVRIPDALESGNEAGFFWDAQPPAGVHTLRVFASTDLATAEAVRRWVRAPSLATRGTPASGTASPAVGFERLERLRLELASGSVRPASATRSAGAGAARSGGPPDWNAVSIRVEIAN